MCLERREQKNAGKAIVNCGGGKPCFISESKMNWQGSFAGGSFVCVRGSLLSFVPSTALHESLPSNDSQKLDHRRDCLRFLWRATESFLRILSFRNDLLFVYKADFHLCALSALKPTLERIH